MDIPERIKRVLAWRWLPLALALLAMTLSWPALLMGFHVDDWLQRMVHLGEAGFLGYEISPFDMFSFVDGNPEHTQSAMDYGFLPWWTNKEIMLSFWRPLTVLTHILDYRLWPDSPFLMHLHSLIWLGFCVAAAGLFYRRVIGTPWIAGLAALLFAIEDAHSLPAGWLANRNTLIALTFSLLAILAHIRWRRDGDRRAALMAPILFLLALLTKEAGIATAAWIFAFALFLDRGAIHLRALTLTPYAVVLIGWRIVYTALGYGIRGGDTYRDPIHEPLAFWAYAVERGPVLFFSQWALPAADIHIGLPRPGQLVFLIIALLFLVFWIRLFLPLLRQNAEARFFATGMVLSILPVCATFPSDRLLVYAGLGAMGLLAIFLTEWPVIYRPYRPVIRRNARYAAIFFIIMHLILAPFLLPARIAGTGFLFSSINRIVLNAPLDDSVKDKTVIVVNAPNVFFTSYLPLVRKAYGMPLPAAVRSLGPNSTLMYTPIEITRPDEYSLIFRPEGGYPWFLTRNGSNPFTPGETVEIKGMTTTILSNADAGWPETVQFRFDVPLEDPSLIWLQFDFSKGGYTPFTPPAIDQSLYL